MALRSLLTSHEPDTRLGLQAFLDAVRSGSRPTAAPLSLAETRAATLTGLLVRKAVDERRSVTMAEIGSEAPEPRTQSA